jgi:hypothetical protein
MFITSKEQVTTSVEIRRKAGLHSHTEVEFVIAEGRVLWQSKPGERVVAAPNAHFFRIFTSAPLRLFGGMMLLTRDATRYRSCFPKLKLVSPEPS